MRGFEEVTTCRFYSPSGASGEAQTDAVSGYTILGLHSRSYEGAGMLRRFRALADMPLAAGFHYGFDMSKNEVDIKSARSKHPPSSLIESGFRDWKKNAQISRNLAG